MVFLEVHAGQGSKGRSKLLACNLKKTENNILGKFFFFFSCILFNRKQSLLEMEYICFNICVLYLIMSS